MIWLAISLLAQPVPPAPSGRPLPPGAVEILDPIAPALARYERCLGEKFSAVPPTRQLDADGHRRAVNQAIAQCADVRRAAIAEADRALSQAPDYKDPVKRDLAIRHAFEGTEQVRRELMTMVAAGLLPTRSPTFPAPPNIRVPRRVMPAAMHYMRCMTDGTNAAMRVEGEARQAKVAALDADCRTAARQALPKAVIGTTTTFNPAEVAALDKAMDEMGASITKTFLPGATQRRGSAPGTGSGAANAQE